MTDGAEMVSEHRYFVRWRGRVSGPIGSSCLIEQLRTGRISKHHQVSDDRHHWTTIAEHEEFMHECVRGASNARGASESASADNVGRAGHARLRLRTEVQGAESAAEDNWYYVEDDEVAGPVTLDVVRTIIGSGRLPKDVPLCKEGEDIWRHASELLGSTQSDLSILSPALSAPEPVPEPVNVLAGDERVCLACGRIHRGRGTFCQHCGKELEVTNRKYGGIGRLAYVGCSVGLGFLQGFISVGLETLEGYATLSVVFLLLHLVAIVFRLQNTGSSGWWSLFWFVPIANIVLAIYCLAYQEGYRDSNELDADGKVIVGILIGLMVLAVLGVFILLAAA